MAIAAIDLNLDGDRAGPQDVAIVRVFWHDGSKKRRAILYLTTTDSFIKIRLANGPGTLGIMGDEHVEGTRRENPGVSNNGL